MEQACQPVDWSRLGIRSGGDAEAGDYWMLPSNHLQSFEVVVSGDSAAPDSLAMALAAEITAERETHFAAGIAYLRAFVDPQKLESADEWYPEGLSFLDQDRSFEIQYSLQDDSYGLWTVQFAVTANKPPSPRIVPIKFARVQT